MKTKNKILQTTLRESIGLAEKISRPFVLQMLKLKFRGKIIPSALNIETTNLCNLKCKMCPHFYITRRKEIMSMDLYTKILYDAKEYGIKELYLNNYGEPLLDPLIFERIKLAKTFGFRVGFFTNGYYLELTKIEKLLEVRPDFIQISFDGGFKESYEKIRVGSNFERVRENIKLLISKKKELKLEKPYITITCTIYPGIHKKEEYKILQEMFKDADEIRISRCDNRRKDNQTKRIININGSYPCPFILSLGVVLVDGSVVPCCLDYNGKIVLGNISKQKLSEIYNSPQYKKFLSMHMKGKGHELDLCKDCDYLYSFVIG